MCVCGNKWKKRNGRKALVKYNDKLTVVESEYRTKKEFITDLRANGYKVNVNKVKLANVFDYIIECTECSEWDWKENK